MSPAQIVIAAGFVVLVSAQILIMKEFAKVLLKAPEPTNPEPDLPPALVVMALRGGDEFLGETLERLTSLDYPDFILKIVLDSESDSAVPIIESYFRGRDTRNVETIYLGRRPLTCSGKIAGVLRGTEDIPDNCKVVAIVDGDAVLHPSCLRELVGPLLRGAGLTSGNRWYTPSAKSFGGMIRYIWNGLAVNVMPIVQIPWGGCMAMHASSMSAPDLRDRLSKAFGEDSTVATYMREQGGRIEFVPDAIVVNSEACSVGSLYNFLVRQYLTVRLHNRIWKLVFAGIMLIGGSVVGGYGLLLVEGGHRWPIICGIAAVTAMACCQLGVSGHLIRSRKRAVGLPYPKFSIQHGLLLLPAMFCCAVVNMVAAVHAAVARQHIWRGITYQFTGGSTVKVVNVEPTETEANSKVSAALTVGATQL